MIRAAAALALAWGAACATAQDYEREKRWAAEIVPNVVVGDAVQLKLPSGRDFLGLYTEHKGARAAVLLLHGVGVHPDHGVIGMLRIALAEKGYATLAIQLPVQKSDAQVEDYYPTVFPEAVERIRTAGRWLQERGYPRLALLSHSMGSWMANVYFEQTADPPFAAWLCMGLTGGFGGMRNVRVPVLDVYGENDLVQVLRADWRRRATLQSIEGSKQVRVAGADHQFTGREKELAAEIRDFLAGLK
ncbi:MAG: dienelactone hydrolase family protein [Burkholderiales bacterium]